MNPIDFQLTESVQGAGGAGFSVPIFRAGMPVDATTATPQARSGLGIDYLAGIEMDGLDPVSAMRDAFDQEVANTYEWIAGVVEKGYDPTKIDMSDPNSKAVYLDFMTRRRNLAKMSDNLRLSMDLKRRGNFLADPTADAKETLEMGEMPDFFRIVQEGNKIVSASGFDDPAAFQQGLADFEARGAQLLDSYARYREIAKKSPAKLALLDARFSEALAARQKPFFSGMTDLQKRRLDLETQRTMLQYEKLKLEKDKNAYQLDLLPKVQSVMNPDGTDGSYESEVLTTPQVKFSSTEGYALRPPSAYESKGGRVNTPVFQKALVNTGTIDKYEIIAVDSKGVPIVSGSGKNSADIAGYKVFAVGEGKYGDAEVPVWTDASAGRNKYSAEINPIVASNIKQLEQKAAEMTKQLGKTHAATSTAKPKGQASTSAPQFIGVPSGGFNKKPQ